MIRRALLIFIRDLKVSTRDFLTVYIILVPILFAVVINLLVPSVNETTVSLAFLRSDEHEYVDFYRDFAIVEEFDSLASVEHRLNKRDNIVAILPEENSHYILTQGNEPEGVVDLAKLLKTLQETDTAGKGSNAEIVDYGHTIPPLKKLLVAAAMLFTSVLGGMLIAMSIVEEKVDQTVSALNVTPMSRGTFVLGKSLMGVVLAIMGSFALVLLTGFRDISFGQLTISILGITLISVMVGFIQGLNSDDVITAAGGIKLLFMPLAGAIAATELLNSFWQKFFYPLPYYWSYKSVNEILSNTATWPSVLGQTGIVVLLAALLALFIVPRIRKGLE
ncbi:ABC transporter permease [Clostridia bacterium]|nr:ABC transporter permease [Clostridia bacterium]